jgi:hypothetical protein
LTLPSGVTLTKSLAGASGYGKCPSRLSGVAVAVPAFELVAGLAAAPDGELTGAGFC